MNGLKQIETAIRALARNRDALEERLFEQRDLLRNAYVDRLLHGADPAEIAIERGFKSPLTINLRAAAALGLQLPPALLDEADHLID